MKAEKAYQVVIIGGGASGMTAGIAALEKISGAGGPNASGVFCGGAKDAREKAGISCGGGVLILESNDRVGRKLLATGNGKCNFTHESVSAKEYHTDDREALQAILERFSTKDAVRFFERLGMLSTSKNGSYYPLTETASTVLDVLRLRFSELGGEVECNVRVKQVRQAKNGGYVIEYALRESGENPLFSGAEEGASGCGEIRACAESVIIATGSGAGGFLQDKRERPLRIAESLGLHITPLYPALAKCICREDFYPALAGVRAHVRLSLYEKTDFRETESLRKKAEDTAGGALKGCRLLRQEEGELQLTKEGISGIVVFQISGDIAQMLAERKRAVVEINFLPGFSQERLDSWADERLKAFPGRGMEEFFLGVFHKKLLPVFLRRECFKGPITKEAVLRVMRRAMHFTTEAAAVADIRQAQVCRGGICLAQLDGNLECKKLPGVFACGEALNVDGICGGYNLHFAWASGYIAGCSAAG